MLDLDELELTGKLATPSPWERCEQQQRPDANYFEIRDSAGDAILDTANSENQEVHEERDEGCLYVWDEIGRRNTEFIVTARNNWQALIDEIRRLRQRLLSAAGDDLCRLSQEEINELSAGVVRIPPREEFLASCEQFHTQMISEVGVIPNCLTLAQLVTENERLREDNRKLQNEIILLRRGAKQ